MPSPERNSELNAVGTVASGPRRYADVKPLPDAPPLQNPFLSSLFDSVKLKIDVNHSPLEQVCVGNSNVRRRRGNNYLVMSRFAGVTAHIKSWNDHQQLIIEASIPKFLTGQNVVGTEDLPGGCSELVFEVLKRAGISMSKAERLAIAGGNYALLRVDYTCHCDCGTEVNATALMTALRNLLVATAGDISMYGLETLYVHQHSSRWTVRIYRKDIELKKRPIPDGVYGRKFLTSAALGLVRIERTVKGEELKRLGLARPEAWTSERARKDMDSVVRRLRRAGGRIPVISNEYDLAPTPNLKLRAWLFGDQTAFTRTPTTLRKTRKLILELTGIDVTNSLSPELQRVVFLSVRKLFRVGFGYRDHQHKWKALLHGDPLTQARKVVR